MNPKKFVGKLLNDNFVDCLLVLLVGNNNGGGSILNGLYPIQVVMVNRVEIRCHDGFAKAGQDRMHLAQVGKSA